MNMWSQNTQRRVGSISDFPQQNLRQQNMRQQQGLMQQQNLRQQQTTRQQLNARQQQMQSSMRQNQNQDDFDCGDEFLFERRNRNQLLEPDNAYDDISFDDNSQDNFNQGRVWSMGDNRRGGGGGGGLGSGFMSRKTDPEPLMSKSTFSSNQNWMGDEPRGMNQMNLDFDMSQGNFNQNRNWMGNDRGVMSRPVDSNNSMFQNNFNQNRNRFGINLASESDNSMSQNNFNRNDNRNWGGNDRRGMKRPMENNFGSFQNNSNRDKPNWMTDKKTRQNKDDKKQQHGAAAPADNKIPLWETKWNEKYPSFRIPGNYKLVQKWEKSLQPQNAIQIFNQMVKSGVEIPCQEEPREENPDDEPLGPTMFIAHAKVDGQSYKGVGPSKKLAQQSAAENALKAIFKKMLHNANIKKETSSIEIDRNDLVPWNYITSFGLYKFISEIQNHEPISLKPNIAVIATAAFQQKPAPPQELPPNAVELNPYKLLFKMKPGISVTRLTDMNESHVEFETIIDGKRFTGRGALPQDARKALAKNALSGLYGIAYPEEEANSAAPGELPKNAAFWNPYKLLLRMKPDVIITREGAAENSPEDPITVECSIDGQVFTESGKTINEARSALGRKICQALYGVTYPVKNKKVENDAKETEKTAPEV